MGVSKKQKTVDTVKVPEVNGGFVYVDLCWTGATPEDDSNAYFLFYADDDDLLSEDPMYVDGEGVPTREDIVAHLAEGLDLGEGETSGESTGGPNYLPDPDLDTPMPRKDQVIHLVLWDHKHGTDLSVHLTKKGAEEQALLWLHESLREWGTPEEIDKYLADESALWADFHEITGGNEFMELDTLTLKN